MPVSHADDNAGDHGTTRRDFLYYATAGAGAIAAGAAGWTLINQMNPSADVQALSSIQVDISGVTEGTQLTVKWLGKPVFIRHRTPAEIEQGRADDTVPWRHQVELVERLRGGDVRLDLIDGGDHRLGIGAPADRAGDTQHQSARQEPLLERAQGLGQRQLGDPCQQTRMAGDREIQDPRPDRYRQRDDGGSRCAFGDRRRE